MSATNDTEGAETQNRASSLSTPPESRARPGDRGSVTSPPSPRQKPTRTRATPGLNALLGVRGTPETARMPAHPPGNLQSRNTTKRALATDAPTTTSVLGVCPGPRSPPPGQQSARSPHLGRHQSRGVPVDLSQHRRLLRGHPQGTPPELCGRDRAVRIH